MTYYDIEARKNLGRFIGRSRRAAGYADTDTWANAVGRSTRTVLGIERGDSAGPKTYARIEELLGWYTGSCYEILDGVDPATAINAKPVSGAAQDVPDYVSGPGDKVEGGASDSEVLRAIEQMRQDVQAMERRLSERLDRLEGPGA